MTYQFEPYDPNKLSHAVRISGTCSFTLLTGEPEDLGVFDPDDQAQLRNGGRFDLSPWRALPSRGLLAGPPKNGQEILQDASQHAKWLYIQLDPSAGLLGTGEFSATFNPLETPTLRTVTVRPKS